MWRETSKMWEAMPEAERILRHCLAFAYSGPRLYGDDGELHDASEQPWIDYLRDSAQEIQRKISERGNRRLAGLVLPTAAALE